MTCVSGPVSRGNLQRKGHIGKREMRGTCHAEREDPNTSTGIRRGDERHDEKGVGFIYRKVLLRSTTIFWYWPLQAYAPSLHLMIEDFQS